MTSPVKWLVQCVLKDLRTAEITKTSRRRAQFHTHDTKNREVIFFLAETEETLLKHDSDIKESEMFLFETNIKHKHKHNFSNGDKILMRS